MAEGGEKKKIPETRLKSAAGKSELSVSDSSGAAAIYNAVTQPESGRRRVQRCLPGLISLPFRRGCMSRDQ